jgi:hypothetical protein
MTIVRNVFPAGLYIVEVKDGERWLKGKMMIRGNKDFTFLFTVSRSPPKSPGRGLVKCLIYYRNRSSNKSPFGGFRGR